MSQGSLTLSCTQTGSNYNDSIKTALLVLNSLSSGSLAPTNNLTEGKLWLDIATPTSPILKIYDASDSTFRTFATFKDDEWVVTEATILETARTFQVSGDVSTASPISFDGSSNVNIVITLDANTIDLVHMNSDSVDSDQYVDGSVDFVKMGTDVANAQGARTIENSTTVPNNSNGASGDIIYQYD